MPGIPGLREVRSAVSHTPEAARDMWSRARASARRRHGGQAGPHQVAWTLVVQQVGRVGRLLQGVGGRTDNAPVRSPRRARAAKPATRPAGRTVRSRAGSRRGGTLGAADVGRQELYAMARDLGIPGRSRMSKRELAEAVRRATGGAVRGTASARSRPSRSAASRRSSSRSSRGSSGAVSKASSRRSSGGSGSGRGRR
ncbi:Rho termination factor N-terminal domain-containing protein [Actinomadura rubrobrunea]|uniref:Rho termination factor N-terminal domain-containing protein n=1 Tax=Actinomadura rubrobrunea TaxID=115335 RepID=UPI001C3F205D|nr:Rho termination factor N-terminal domain-containing protein [Actinomadura rubrobrunea]